MTDPIAELRSRFVAEAVDRTQQIDVLLASLPAAEDPAAICDAIRDHAHRLKGASGIFGYSELSARTAELEEEAAAQAGAADGSTAAGALQAVFDEVAGVIPTE